MFPTVRQPVSSKCIGRHVLGTMDTMNSLKIRTLITAVAVIGAAAPSLAEDVFLRCEGQATFSDSNCGSGPPGRCGETTYYTVIVAHEIRLNEDTNEFWTRGTGKLLSKKTSVDGWIPGTKVDFQPTEIKVNLDRAWDPRPLKGTLNRQTGNWTFGRNTIPCQKVERAQTEVLF